MYLEEIVSLTDYLANAKRTLDEICKHLVIHTFKELTPRAIYVGQVEPNGMLALRSSFGFDPTYISQWQQIPLTVNIPITEAIRNDQALIFNSQDDFFTQYPEVNELGTIDRDWSSCIASPVQTLGAYFLVLNGSPSQGSELELFLKLIGHLLAIQFQENVPVYTYNSRVEPRLVRLSQRQELIKDLLEKGFTNYHIAQEIGFSESLVRQETIAIYSAMKVSGRKELMKLAESNINSMV